MTIPNEPSSPSEPVQPPQDQSEVMRARRRRATRRSMIPTDAEGQAALIASLARRAHASYELFIFSILCGAVLGLGYLLDSQAVVFLGGLLTGFAARIFLPLTLTSAFIHSRLWIPELIVLVIGAITLIASFVRSE